MALGAEWAYSFYRFPSHNPSILFVCLLPCPPPAAIHYYRIQYSANKSWSGRR
ncbi:uncharacterized protein K489DRAFT_380433 [Dissoconium aciculare CBS 342.82]|uniref:Uncharacterized protein n=1 Tax=Dissoconium aciculare CBS 342.82 TaxID=1314786 RepID=A0A6J3M588_9PEZI|nr:uncharacterized protein K489DRAFT_380433 [Dissoconium aciculare CBS 342.82]KAF1823038.1 hypothetical protein K489DRAFT_380433 [Dissoconium aciculare CBS 342.82]